METNSLYGYTVHLENRRDQSNITTLQTRVSCPQGCDPVEGKVRRIVYVCVYFNQKSNYNPEVDIALRTIDAMKQNRGEEQVERKEGAGS